MAFEVSGEVLEAEPDPLLPVAQLHALAERADPAADGAFMREEARDRHAAAPSSINRTLMRAFRLSGWNSASRGTKKAGRPVPGSLQKR